MSSVVSLRAGANSRSEPKGISSVVSDQRDHTFKKKTPTYWVFMYLPRTCGSTTDVTAQVKLLKFYCVSVLEGKKDQFNELSTSTVNGHGKFWSHQATKRNGRDLRKDGAGREHSEQNKWTLSYVQYQARLSDAVQQKCVVKAVSKQTGSFRAPEAGYSCCRSSGWLSFIFDLKHQSGNNSQKCTKLLTLLMWFWHGQIDLMCWLKKVLHAALKGLDYCIVEFTDFTRWNNS